ncbi:DUF421 domain-containing protein [Paenibacillus glucanolyticus]|jgi:uncharacterized membrane protein YcaP (DUF421 family)|uniref:DUF421 domain-containing protein n=1 Tax=Paenibacillus TaxID=44249 RepID=UPI0003E298DA|nr:MULTISPECIES: DUF421 domain-containing protein [Paenibacillus]ANA80618.1 hypothetical protein A3958_11840 [Paenibacillus glucanolyticus]AVV55313.1 DUF421 domain-containing protein [Paenibacillus glucanolyticus]ETT30930.1 hypothetical protein C169_26850 [Paenibacillus sp. FSL R5-808]MDH6671453.1 uncharacterized membrane protein YcaP (DUF421 family) [Paenibacillus sp. LBL]OMF80016.1 DUF421 domain-containing protein [Paenibacillus glucanolyticus]
MELIKDLLVVLGRIYTIYPLLLAVTLFMGRRSVAELPVFDYIIILSLGSVIGADIADPHIEHIPTIFAIVAIGVLQKIGSVLLIKSRLIGKWMTFEPIIVIKDGQFLHKNLKKARYPIDNILQMLREDQIFDINTVDMAVLEPNGTLSVLKKMEKMTVTLEDLKLKRQDSGLSYAIIKEGRVQTITLQKLNLTGKWLENQLSEREILLDQVFFASLDEQMSLNITVYDKEIPVPPLYH